MPPESIPINPQIVMLYHSVISPSPLNPRKHFDQNAIIELANDIRLNGILQPITVRPYDGLNPHGHNPYVIVLGERRWRAARQAEVENIPCIVRTDLDDAAHLRLAYSENAKRSDLTPIECGEAYRRMLELEPSLTQEGLGSRLGVSQARIANRLRLLKLPPAVCRFIDSGTISESVALELCRLIEWPDLLTDAVDLAISEQWTQATAIQRARAIREEQDYREKATAAQVSLDIEPEPPKAEEEAAPLTGKSRMDYSAPNNTEDQEDAIVGDVMEGDDQEESDAALFEEMESVRRSAHPLPSPTPIVYYNPPRLPIPVEELERAAKMNCCQTLAESKKTPTVPLFYWEGEPYVISGSAGTGHATSWANGYHVVHRESYDGPIRTYQECIARRVENRARPDAFVGMLVRFKNQEFVTDGNEVEFRPIETATEFNPFPNLEVPETQPIAVTANTETLEAAINLEPAPKALSTLPQELEDWLFENALTPEKAIEQLRRLKPYAISPMSRRLVDKAIKLLPEDHPCHTPGAFIDGAIGLRAAQLGVEVPNEAEVFSDTVCRTVRGVPGFYPDDYRKLANYLLRGKAGDTSELSPGRWRIATETLEEQMNRTTIMQAIEKACGKAGVNV